MKWTSVCQRLANSNGRCRSYVGTPLGFAKDDFIQWVLGNPPPADMERPSIDRIDPVKGYVPGNIRWLEMRQNSRMSQRDTPDGFWICPGCKEMKVLSATNFVRSSKSRSGFASRCKQCKKIERASR